MKPLRYKKGPWLSSCGKNEDKRYHGILEDGRKIYRARLVMMNFLHTNHLPSCLVVHHKDENGINDDISNLQLITQSKHIKLHKIGKGKYGVTTDDINKYNRVRRSNSKIKEKCRIYAKKYYAKMKHDPVFMKKHRDRMRKNYRKGKEAEI